MSNFNLITTLGRGRERSYLLNTEIDRNLIMLLMFILQQIFQLQILKGDKVVTTPLSMPSPISSWYSDQSSSNWIHANFFIKLLWVQNKKGKKKRRKNQIPELVTVYYIEPKSDSYQVGGISFVLKTIKQKTKQDKYTILNVCCLKINSLAK